MQMLFRLIALEVSLLLFTHSDAQAFSCDQIVRKVASSFVFRLSTSKKNNDTEKLARRTNTLIYLHSFFSGTADPNREYPRAPLLSVGRSNGVDPSSKKFRYPRTSRMLETALKRMIREKWVNFFNLAIDQGDWRTFYLALTQVEIDAADASTVKRLDIRWAEFLQTVANFEDDKIEMTELIERADATLAVYQLFLISKITKDYRLMAPGFQRPNLDFGDYIGIQNYEHRNLINIAGRILNRIFENHLIPMNQHLDVIERSLWALDQSQLEELGAAILALDQLSMEEGKGNREIEDLKHEAEQIYTKFSNERELLRVQNAGLMKARETNALPSFVFRPLYARRAEQYGIIEDYRRQGSDPMRIELLLSQILKHMDESRAEELMSKFRTYKQRNLNKLQKENPKSPGSIE